jgi:hypothetical protein
MAVISIKNKTKSGSLLVGNEAFNPNAFVSLATVTASGSQSTLTFSSIPQTYASLQIRGITRDSSGSGHLLTLRFNADSGSNYAYHMLVGGGAGTVSALGYTGQSRIAISDQPQDGDFAANIFAPFVCDIHDYISSTKNKTVRSFCGKNGGAASYMEKVSLMSGVWLNTNAVTSITLVSDANWVAGSTFSLYGIKGA